MDGVDGWNDMHSTDEPLNGYVSVLLLRYSSTNRTRLALMASHLKRYIGAKKRFTESILAMRLTIRTMWKRMEADMAHCLSEIWAKVQK